MSDWALFIDRDGVINRKPPEHQHIETAQDFILLPGATTAIRMLHTHFRGIFIVSNQRGVDGGVLKRVNYYMLEQLAIHGAMVDDVSYAVGTDDMRKPEVGMAHFIKSKHTWVDFKRSVMVGDSMTDMQFGRNLRMKNVWISPRAPVGDEVPLVDILFKSLYDFALFHDACLADNQLDWRYEV